MTLGLALLFGHITVMVAAVAISYGPAVSFSFAVRSGQVALVRGAATATPLGIWIPILYVAGGLLGLATAINFGYNLLAPWLVIAYVLWTVAMINGGAIHAPFFAKVAKLAAATPDGPIGGDLAVLLADRRERIASWIDYAIIVVLLFDMVFKPFS